VSKNSPEIRFLPIELEISWDRAAKVSEQRKSLFPAWLSADLKRANTGKVCGNVVSLVQVECCYNRFN